MATLSPCVPNIVFSAALYDRTKTWNPLQYQPHTHYHTFSHSKHFLRGSLSVARFCFKTGFLPEPDGARELAVELLGRAEGLIYTIADAAVSSSDMVTTTTKQSNDWLSGITSYMECVLKVLKDGLSTLHVPYAYGFAIILLTILVKAATFPLTKKQVESAMAMRSLQPQIKAIQQRYAGDQERIQLETARLYKLAGINPLAGCLPTLATIPVWIGLYRALSNVADEGLLTEGFFWIPSLAGPTTIAARQNGSGISWLFPFVDGQPPLGWSDTLAYLVLPLLLVVSQYISVQIMQSTQASVPNMKSSQALTKLLPLMIGYFALSVPSGLSLYWLTNNILSTAQQIWLQKLGGAQNPVGKVRDDILKVNPMPVQKLVSELNLTKEASGERLTSDGPRPGERFKQIKEQEARRQQKEEEKRKAEMGAAEGTDVNEAREQTFQGGNVTKGDLVDKKRLAMNANNNASTSAVAVNGQTSELEGNRNATNEASAYLQTDGKSEKHSNEAVELHTNTATTDKNFTGEDPQQAAKD